MLFYYFKSKNDLFLFLVDYAIEYVTDNYINQLDISNTDFIERVKQTTQIKIQALRDNPYVFNFLAIVFLSEDVDLPADLSRRIVDTKEAVLLKQFENIDTSLFRDDVASDILLKLIQWSLEGYEKDLTSSLNSRELHTTDYQSHIDDFYCYLDTLKKIFYKQEA